MAEQDQIKNTGPLQQRYKAFKQILLFTMTIALCSFYFGYTIAYFSSIQFETFMKIYDITWDKQTAQGILIACIPIGGGIGALSSDLLMKKFSRRQFIFIVNGFAFLLGFLLYIQNLYVLLFVRLLQGVCVGFFSSITPVFIKQISPTQISGTLGALIQFFIGFGIFFCLLFKLILEKIADDQSGQKTWWIVFGFPLIVILLQTVLLQFVYRHQTPRYLLQNNKQSQAREFIKQFYKQQFIDQVLEQKYEDLGKVNTNRSKEGTDSIVTNQIRQAQQSESLLMKDRVDRPVAKLMALHLALLQQFVGINAVVGYGGDIAGKAVPSLKSILPMLINLEVVLGCFIVSYLLSKFGRKTILQIGSIVGGISNVIVGVGFFIHESNQSLGNVFIILGLAVFMGNFGISLGPVVWLYIPEIVQPTIVPYSTGVNWGGAALVMLLFPIITKNLPSENPAPLFFFFGAWCVGSFFLNAKFLIETKGKTQKQIFKEYSKIKFIC